MFDSESVGATELNINRRLYSKIWVDALKLWCWIRLLRVPWTARRSNKSILKEINQDIQWSWNSTTLANWCEELTLKKNQMLGKTDGRKRRGQQRMRCFNGITDSMDMSLSKFWEMVKDKEAWPATVHGSQRVGHDWGTEQQQQQCVLRATEHFTEMHV